jgi:hypothetical protein
MLAWRDGHQPHGRSLASDPHGSGKCHYDDGIIFDPAIAAFVSPFTSDGTADLSLNQVPWTTLAYITFITLV